MKIHTDFYLRLIKLDIIIITIIIESMNKIVRYIDIYSTILPLR